MLSKVKSIKTETKFMERGSIHINRQHIDSINRQIKQGIDEKESKNENALEKILDKIYK